MADLKEKIARLFPDASFDDANILVVNIPDAQWHKLAQTLRDELGFDWLVTIVGMDWAESLGCYYYLTSTKSGEHISIRVATTDRLKPMLHSVADLWAIAGIYEREVYDFFGIVFINNPDMRRLFLSIDWKGFPLRKDYDADEAVNPVSTENERQTDFTDTWVEDASGKVVKKEVRVSVSYTHLTLPTIVGV